MSGLPDVFVISRLRKELHKGLSGIWKRKLLLFLVAIVLTVAVSLRFAPYVINNPEFEVGFDTGIYERFLGEYKSSEYWRGSLPAYPTNLPASDSGFINVMEPGFFVELGFIYSFSDMDIHDLFRYYLPALTSFLTFCLVFVVGRRLTGSDLGGLAAGFLFAVSNIQYEAINESYYKQVFGILALVAAVYGLDRYSNGADKRYFFPTVLLGGSTYFYHRPSAFTFFLLLFALLAYTLVRRNWSMLRGLLKVTVVAFTVTLPVLIPRLDIELSILKTALYSSVARVGMYGTEQGSLYAGGATPGVLQGFNHVLFGYILVFAPVVILAIIASRCMLRRRRLLLFVFLAALLSAYIGLWLYFGNRVIYELDIVMIILAAGGIVIIWEHASNAKLNPGLWRKVVAVLVAALVLGSIGLGFVYQAGKEPIITDNLEGVRWIEDNLDPAQSVIFAPDYLSAELLQRDWRLAMWDYSLVPDNRHPIDVAETFILEAPSNRTYMELFFSDHPSYSNLDIYVTWGTTDLESPLISSQEFIPFDAYKYSSWFELSYDGWAEILKVYHYIGSF